MKVTDEVLESLDRDHIRSYLSRMGWMHVGNTPEVGEWFEKFGSERHYEVLVLFESAKVYKQAYLPLMGAIFNVLEEEENRSQLDILEDLKR